MSTNISKKMFAYYNGTKDAFSKQTKKVIVDDIELDKLLSELYNLHIVFITGDGEGKDSAIYAHGTYYANVNQVDFSSLSTDLGTLQNTVNNLKIIKGISVNGQNKKESTGHNGILDFTGDDIVFVSSEGPGIKISASEAVKDAIDKKHEHSNKDVLDAITPDKVSAWDSAQSNVIETVKVNGVALTPDADKAVNVEFEIPEASVTGVKAGDKVLKLNGTELETAVSFGKENIDGVEYLIVRGLDGAELGKVPTAEFTADSFLNDVTINSGKINFVWQMADGSEKVDEVDLSDYISPYSEGVGINIDDNNVISVELDSNSESFLSVSASGLKLSGVQDAIDTAISGKNVEAEGDDFVSASAANNKVSVSATLKTQNAIALAETALQEVTKEDSDYATVTVGTKTEDHKQSIKVDVKVQAIASASAEKQGFADANDVRLEIAGAKSYADDLFAWEEL